MLIKVENKIYKCELKKWTPSGYTPDCFDGIETNVNFNEDLEVNECTPDEFRNLCEFWENEVEKTNKNGAGEVLELSEDEQKRGEEWRFEHFDDTAHNMYILEA